jgi:hypothetical protein
MENACDFTSRAKWMGSVAATAQRLSVVDRTDNAVAGARGRAQRRRREFAALRVDRVECASVFERGTAKSRMRSDGAVTRRIADEALVRFDAATFASLSAVAATAVFSAMKSRSTRCQPQASLRAAGSVDRLDRL